MSSQAYTPGLKRKARYIVKKIRKLPIAGQILVSEKDKVIPETILARTSVPGQKHLINVAEKLDIYPEKIRSCMLKKEGDKFQKDEVIARKSGFFSKKDFTAPLSGIIERISTITGEVIVSELPVLVEINAYIPGIIDSILPNEGAIVSTNATFLQGIFGIGGETWGELLVLSKTPDTILDADQITPNCHGKIVVGGSLVTGNALLKAKEVGVKGVVVGGIMNEAIRDLLGYEIGVAITGTEEVGLTLVIMEGFGKMSMSENVYNLLRQAEGKLACINGATQIRAGVIRPEVIIPQTEDASLSSSTEEKTSEGLNPGTTIRVIRQPYFGSFGKVVELPKKLQIIETESPVRVLTARLDDGRIVTVPRADVEIIEE